MQSSSTRLHRERAASHSRKTPRYVLVSTAAIPVLILTGFGLVTTIPVIVSAIAALADRRVAHLRPGIALTTGLFAGPFVEWLVRTDPGASLTSLLHPLMAIAIVTAALATLAVMVGSKRLLNAGHGQATGDVQ